MKKLDLLAAVLVIVGGLNWGLVAIAEFDLVAALFGLDFGETNAATRIVYGLVGIAAVYGVARLATTTRRVPSARATGLATLAVLALAASASAALAAPQHDARAQRGTIVQTAVAAGKFTTLVALVKQAGLAPALSGTTKLTVFAPTDAAFRNVPAATLAKLRSDKALLKRVLLYHVVKGAVTSKRVVGLTSARTLAGPSVRIRLRGGTVRVNGARVTKADVAATNGVIHVVDRVLVPPAA